MGQTLEVIGCLIVAATMTALLFLSANMPPYWAGWVMLIWSVPPLVGGLLIVAFGRMLQELTLMRAQSEKQTRLMEAMARNAGSEGG